MALNPANFTWNGVTEETSPGWVRLNGAWQFEYTDLTQTIAQLDNEQVNDAGLIATMRNGDVVVAEGSDGYGLFTLNIQDPNNVSSRKVELLFIAGPFPAKPAGWWK